MKQQRLKEGESVPSAPQAMTCHGYKIYCLLTLPCQQLNQKYWTTHVWVSLSVGVVFQVPACQILHIYYTKCLIFKLWGAFLFGQFFSLIGFLWALLRIHLLRVQVSMLWPGILSLTALTMKVFNLFPLITLHPSCPTNTPLSPLPSILAHEGG